MDMKTRIQNIVSKNINLNEKLARALHSLKALKVEQQSLISEIFNKYLDNFLKEVESAVSKKESYIEEAILNLKKRRIQTDEIMKMVQNCYTINDMKSVESKLREIDSQAEDSLESLLILNFVMQPNFNIHNLGFLQVSNKLPQELKFYVTKKASTPYLEQNEIISIRVLSNNSSLDPFVINSLVCKVFVPQDGIKNLQAHSAETILEGEVLSDNSLLYSYKVSLVGRYIIQILLYGVDIMDSPSSFDVVQKSCTVNEVKSSCFSEKTSSNSFSFDNSQLSEISNSNWPNGLSCSPADFSHLDSSTREPLLCAGTSLPLTTSPFVSCATKDKLQKTFPFESPGSSPKFVPSDCASDSVLNSTFSSLDTATTNLLMSKDTSCSSADSIKTLEHDTSPTGSNFVEKIDETRKFWRENEGWMIERNAVKIKAKFLWCSEERAKLHFPIGVHPTPEDNIVVCNTTNHSVVLLNNDGRLISSFGKEGRKSGEFYRPSAVVVFEDGKVAVKDDHRIQIFSPNFDYLWSCGNASLHKAYGLAIDGHGRLVTLDVSANSQLYFFSPDGNVIAKKAFSALYPLQPTSKCRFLDADESKVAVVDLGMNCVYISDFNGQLISQFGSKGRKSGQFCDPAGISFDQDHNMFIADSKNSRVQIFNSEGKYKTCVDFGDHPIHRPSDICLSRTGKLLVLNYVDHVLSAYDLESESK